MEYQTGLSLAVMPSGVAISNEGKQHRAKQSVSVVAALLLLLVALPTASRYLHSAAALMGSTSKNAAPGTKIGSGTRKAAGVDVNAAVARASQIPIAVPNEAGTFKAGGNAYGATFDANRLTFAPRGAAGALGIGVTDVVRGGMALPLLIGPWSPQGTTLTRPLGRGVVERVSMKASTLNWDVVLKSAPSGHGNLDIGAAITGAIGAPTQTTIDGKRVLRFALQGGHSVYVNELVVTDALGTALYTSLPAVVGDRLTLTVPGSVLDGASYPLTIDPTVSGPTTVNSDGANPAVASDGDTYLVVWEQQSGGDEDILGARLDAKGTILSGPFFVSSATNDESHPDIAWNAGTETYLVVWEYLETPPLTDYDVHGQRLSRTGGLVGANFLVYGPSTNGGIVYNERHPSVASNNVNWFVAWDQSLDTGIDIYGKMISGSGAVGFATAYASSSKPEVTPDVAWNGSTFLIVYVSQFSSTDWDIYGVVVDPNAGGPLSDGTPNGAKYGTDFPIDGSNVSQFSVGVASANYESRACIGCGDPLSVGGPFLVTYSEQYSSSDSDVYGLLLDWSGVTIKSKFAITRTGDNEVVGPKSVASNGRSYLVVWDVRLSGPPYYKGAYATHVNQNGDVLDNPGFPVLDTPNAELGSAVWSGPDHNWGVAAQSNNGSGNSIQFSHTK